VATALAETIAAGVALAVAADRAAALAARLGMRPGVLTAVVRVRMSRRRIPVLDVVPAGGPAVQRDGGAPLAT
jgi:hypothetical protein